MVQIYFNFLFRCLSSAKLILWFSINRPISLFSSQISKQNRNDLLSFSSRIVNEKLQSFWYKLKWGENCFQFTCNRLIIFDWTEIRNIEKKIGIFFWFHSVDMEIAWIESTSWKWMKQKRIKRRMSRENKTSSSKWAYEHDQRVKKFTVRQKKKRKNWVNSFFVVLFYTQKHFTFSASKFQCENIWPLVRLEHRRIIFFTSFSSTCNETRIAN